jgi:predicted TIM-barrel fold metal-dependent hydrolase
VLHSLGLSFDAWLLEPQLPELIDLARAFPDTTIVLDHVGTPLGIGRYKGKREERFATWNESIKTLAKCPNVNVKLGGLPMPFGGWRARMAGPEETSEALAAQWKPLHRGLHRSLRRRSAACSKATSPSTASARPTPALWNAFKRLTKNASADEKTALYSGTAKRVYRLNVN